MHYDQSTECYTALLLGLRKLVELRSILIFWLMPPTRTFVSNVYQNTASKLQQLSDSKFQSFEVTMLAEH